MIARGSEVCNGKYVIAEQGVEAVADVAVDREPTEARVGVLGAASAGCRDCCPIQNFTPARLVRHFQPDSVARPFDSARINNHKAAAMKAQSDAEASAPNQPTMCTR